MAVSPHNGKIFLLREKIGSSYISTVAASSWPCWVAWLHYRHQHKRWLQFLLNMKILSIKLTDVLILSYMTTTVKPLARAGAVVRSKFELKPTSSGCYTVVRQLDCISRFTAWMPRIAAYLFCANELGEKVKCPQKDAFCNLLKAIHLGCSKAKRAVPNGTFSTEPTAVGCCASHLSGHTKKSALASRVSRSASLRQGCHY